jgi:hypothetical protein
MNIENFFPKFPNIFNYESAILNPYEEDFNNAIVTKKEFENLKLSKYEELNKKVLKDEKLKGEKYNHQKIISRFFSSVTPYDQLLLFHEMEAITYFIKTGKRFIKLIYNLSVLNFYFLIN